MSTAIRLRAAQFSRTRRKDPSILVVVEKSTAAAMASTNVKKAVASNASVLINLGHLSHVLHYAPTVLSKMVIVQLLKSASMTHSRQRTVCVNVLMERLFCLGKIAIDQVAIMVEEAQLDRLYHQSSILAQSYSILQTGLEQQGNVNLSKSSIRAVFNEVSIN